MTTEPAHVRVGSEGPNPAVAGGRLLHGDNLSHLAAIPPRTVDLVYLDPPFNSGRTWTGPRGSFDDRFPSLAEYVDSIRARCVELRRVLKRSGSLYLHCDPNSGGHYLGVMLAEVFGPRSQLASICWRRSQGHSSATRKLPAAHDTIYVVARVPGRHRLNGAPSDFWDDLMLSSWAKERVGYPTQKPLSLLERIIRTSSRPGDVVLDPYCGSGTTLVAAQRLGRRYIGIDSSQDAVAVAGERLSVATTRVTTTQQLDLFGGLRAAS